jgi:hypothetical protein
LDGLVALTNTDIYSPQFDQVTISSNSPQATLIAGNIAFTRNAQSNQRFRFLGDILSTPKLTVNSPFLNLVPGPESPSPYITDEAYEKIPSQLLSLLRADSFGSISQNGGMMQVRFTGGDGCSYATETSSDLLNWTTISTNIPCSGLFQFTEPAPLISSPRFYRSVLLP